MVIFLTVFGGTWYYFGTEKRVVMAKKVVDYVTRKLAELDFYRRNSSILTIARTHRQGHAGKPAEAPKAHPRGPFASDR
jgi:hypothetical protein